MRARTFKSALRLVAAYAAVAVVLPLLATSTPSPAGAAEVTRPPALAATLQYGSEPSQLLDIVVPDPANFRGRRPLIVFLHSGGWIAGDRTNVIDIVQAQVERGYAVASVAYRLATASAPSFPGVVWDVKRAIRYLKASAAEWNLDPRRVIVVGASAGGHLAAFVGATAGEFEPPDLTGAAARADSSVVGIVDLVGPTDLSSFASTDHPWAAPLTAALLGCPPDGASDATDCPVDRLQTASVGPYVDPTDPPIFLADGAQDELVRPTTQGRPLADIWAHAHGDNAEAAWYRELPDAGHTLPTSELEPDFDRFLDTVRDRVQRGRLAIR